ncbi:hypothetical protein EVAR_2983_1 [Eumeta japonica]|uniref:Uncharacterized protein n=1 Tax=Eumeta variegata TaxID=151549 RepID=A0A4C1STA4_EUMVA|nr:hypothetical protein EVAR_2983_1 [Eumeta japonica]
MLKFRIQVVKGREKERGYLTSRTFISFIFIFQTVLSQTNTVYILLADPPASLAESKLKAVREAESRVGTGAEIENATAVETVIRSIIGIEIRKSTEPEMKAGAVVAQGPRIIPGRGEITTLKECISESSESRNRKDMIALPKHFEAQAVRPIRCPTNKIAPHRRISSGQGRTFGYVFQLLDDGPSVANGNLQEQPQADEPDDCGEIEDYDENDLSSHTEWITSSFVSFDVNPNYSTTFYPDSYHTSDVFPACIFDSSIILNCGPNPALDIDPVPFVDSTPRPAFVAKSATNNSSDFDEVSGKC